MSFLTGTNAELIYASNASGATLATFTTEANMNTAATMGPPPLLPAGFFTQSRKVIRVVARGILSSTATPTYTLVLRAATTGLVATGGIVFASNAANPATTLSGATSRGWEFAADIEMGDPTGAAGTTGRGLGILSSGGISNGVSDLFGGGAAPGTINSFDPTAAYTLSVNAACSASSASNSIQLLQLLVFGLN